MFNLYIAQKCRYDPYKKWQDILSKVIAKRIRKAIFTLLLNFSLLFYSKKLARGLGRFKHWFLIKSIKFTGLEMDSITRKLKEFEVISP
jgi:hypothetical protein